MIKISFCEREGFTPPGHELLITPIYCGEGGIYPSGA